MSRKARQRSLTGIYHVIQRGVNRMPVFGDDEDRQMFLNLLNLQASNTFRIYCYCLMSNHTHLMIKSNNLSSNIRHITSIYAMWFNQKYQRSGYLFQDRFKSEVIEDQDYLLCCFRYILQNPVKAGICPDISSYRWSSYKNYFNTTPSFVYTGFISLFFDTKEELKEFLGANTEKQCMDIDQEQKQTDDEVRQILNQKLNGQTFSQLSKDQQKKLLQEMKATTSANLRQLSKITHLKYSTIRYW